MNLQLGGKTALITGSTDGIGYSTAVRLAKEGVFVYLNGRNDKHLQEAIDKLKKEMQEAKVRGIVPDFAKEEVIVIRCMKRTNSANIVDQIVTECLCITF